MIVYRAMSLADIPAGLALCRAAGWNQTYDDWALFLKLSPEGCRVAVDDEGQVRGTVATLRYEDHFSWIGMVLVDPAMQRRGIGIQLLRESLYTLSEEDTIKLDATPDGRKIYVQLDFMDEYRISRVQVRQLSQATSLPSDVRPVKPDDMPQLVDLDRQVFGANRKPVLEDVLRRAPQYAFLEEDQHGLKGYCFGRSGHEHTHIGPLISTSFSTAQNLLSAALESCVGSSVVLDVFHHTPEWISWLSSIGFEEQRPLVRMFRGTNAYPGIPENQFAILGPEFG
jgi:ribosomal protein S18 acetylase RimI-like enzyme